VSCTCWFPVNLFSRFGRASIADYRGEKPTGSIPEIGERVRGLSIGSREPGHYGDSASARADDIGVDYGIIRVYNLAII
jgi:hypothetical protein